MVTGLTSTTEKACKWCARMLPLSAYSPARRGVGGVTSNCKDCAAAHKRDADRMRQPWRAFPPLVGTKRCVKCDELWLLSDFRPYKVGRFGVFSVCRACELVRDREYAKAKPEIVRRAKVKWARTNRDKIARKSRQYLEDPNRRLYNRVQCQVRKAVRGGKQGRQGQRLFDFLGYTPEELKDHIERQFTRGMSWAELKTGRIHIDHIIPVSSFSFSGPDDPEIRRAWGLPNLRPLWATENIVKHSKRTHLI